MDKVCFLLIINAFHSLSCAPLKGTQRLGEYKKFMDVTSTSIQSNIKPPLQENTKITIIHPTDVAQSLENKEIITESKRSTNVNKSQPKTNKEDINSTTPLTTTTLLYLCNSLNKLNDPEKLQKISAYFNSTLNVNVQELLKANTSVKTLCVFLVLKKYARDNKIPYKNILNIIKENIKHSSTTNEIVATKKNTNSPKVSNKQLVPALNVLIQFSKEYNTPLKLIFDVLCNNTSNSTEIREATAPQSAKNNDNSDDKANMYKAFTILRSFSKKNNVSMNTLLGLIRDHSKPDLNVTQIVNVVKHPRVTFLNVSASVLMKKLKQYFEHFDGKNNGKNVSLHLRTYESRPMENVTDILAKSLYDFAVKYSLNYNTTLMYYFYVRELMTTSVLFEVEKADKSTKCVDKKYPTPNLPNIQEFIANSLYELAVSNDLTIDEILTLYLLELKRLIKKRVSEKQLKVKSNEIENVSSEMGFQKAENNTNMLWTLIKTFNNSEENINLTPFSTKENFSEKMSLYKALKELVAYKEHFPFLFGKTQNIAEYKN